MLITINTDTGEMHEITNVSDRISAGDSYLSHSVQKGVSFFVTDHDMQPQTIAPIGKPIDPASEAAVSWMIGQQLFKALKLAECKGEFLGVMRKKDRPEGAGYIQLERGSVFPAQSATHSAELCIAIAPEPKKTTEEVLQDLIDATDQTEARDAAIKHLAK